MESVFCVFNHNIALKQNLLDYLDNESLINFININKYTKNKECFICNLIFSKLKPSIKEFISFNVIFPSHEIVTTLMKDHYITMTHKKFHYKSFPYKISERFNEDDHKIYLVTKNNKLSSMYHQYLRNMINTFN